MLQLVDLSCWQGNTIPAVDGVYLKATEGVGWADSTFAAKRAAAKAKGIPAGAYHFGHPSNDPVAEALHFWAVTQNAGLELIPMLDLEVSDGAPPAEVAAWAARFLTETRALAGACGLYTFHDFITAGNCAGLGGTPLWYARYVPGWGWLQVDHDVPPPFTAADLVLWQYGVRGYDLDQCPSLVPLLKEGVLMSVLGNDDVLKILNYPVKVGWDTQPHTVASLLSAAAAPADVKALAAALAAALPQPVAGAVDLQAVAEAVFARFKAQADK